MLEPEQLHWKRCVYEAGFDEYACAAWSPFLPSGYGPPICLWNAIKWVFPLEGCITGLSIYGFEVPAHATEVVHLRAAYTNAGVPNVTAEVTLTFLDHGNYVTFNLGDYPFQAGDTMYLEHMVTSDGGYNASWLEGVVEVAFE